MSNLAEEIEDTEEGDLASAYAEYDRFSFIALKSLPFKGKSIEEWLEELAIPEVAVTVTPDEFEKLNFFAINLSEKVNRNYSYAKSIFDLVSMKYEAAFHKEKLALLDRYQKASVKIPKAEIVESGIKISLKDTYAALKIAELFFEFWKTLQTKIKSFDGRLTSISMIQNFEKRASKND